MLNTLDAAVGALTGYLVYGRFARERRLQDLLLLHGLGLLVVSGLGLNHVDQLSPSIRNGTLDVWQPDQRHALVRIAREAVTNAVKHGRAGSVHVVLGSGSDGRHSSYATTGAGSTSRPSRAVPPAATG